MNLRNKLAFFIALNSYVELITRGTSPLSLPDAIANSLSYVKAFGGTEQRNLPSGYQELNGVTNGSGTYVDTGITLAVDDVEIEIRAKPTTGSWYMLQSRTSGGTIWGISGSSSGATILLGWGGLGGLCQSAITRDPTHTYYIKATMNNGTATLYVKDETDNTEDTKTNTYTSAVPTLPFWLYGNQNNDRVIAGNTVYMARIKVGGVTVMDYVPALNPSMVVGFYDKATGNFKVSNEGTLTADQTIVPTPDTPMDIVSNNGVLKARHQSGLPLGYALLDYIQSSGSQYIDTLRVPNNNDIIEQKFQKVGTSTTTCSWYGSMPSSQTILPRIGIGSFSNQSVATLFAGSNYTGLIGTVDTNVHTLRFQATGIKELTYTLDGVTGVLDASTSSTPTNMYEPAVELTSYLFARHGTNGVQVYDNEGTKIYYHREYLANGTLVLNMVPVKRNSDNVLGMYDLVSGQFFTNQGTGDFVAGSTVSDPVEIYTDGTVETINAHGKNLLNQNLNVVGKGVASNGSESTASPVYARTAFIKVLPNTTYTMSGLGLVSGAFGRRGAEYSSNNFSSFVKSIEHSDDTFTTSANTNFVCLNTLVSETQQMFELGSTATPYEPYYDGGTATAEMLLKVGDYQDVQSIIDGVVTRNVGIKVLDGTEDWGVVSNSRGYYLGFDNIIGQDYTIMSGYSTHFKFYLWGDNTQPMPVNSFGYNINSVTGLTNGNVTFRPDLTVYNTVDAWKQFLADQYAAGTPVIVIYPLATPTTESVAGQTLQVTDGDNVLEITQASLTGLELEAKYKKRK